LLYLFIKKEIYKFIKMLINFRFDLLLDRTRLKGGREGSRQVLMALGIGQHVYY